MYCHSTGPRLGDDARTEGHYSPAGLFGGSEEEQERK